MKIVFDGLDHPIRVTAGQTSIVTVFNKVLFCRLCQSLLSQKGEEAIEPYTLWGSEGVQLKPNEAFVLIRDPFNLPFTDKRLLGRLYQKITQELWVDEDARSRIQDLHAAIMSSFSGLCMQFNADYEFELEWDESKYLKAFGFGLEVGDDASLLENLICFIDMAADVGLKETMLFINLKTFLSKKDIQAFNERVFFHGMNVLLLENHDSMVYDEIETKMVIDQHFVEYMSSYQLVCPSSSQGGSCSNGFGAVTN